MNTMEVQRYLSIVIVINLVLVFQFQVAFGCDGLRFQTSCVNILITTAKSYSNFANWNEATDDCEKKGYQLVSIHSVDKLSEIQQYIATETRETTFYIGLSRAAGLPRTDKKSWTWPSTISLNYDNWAKGEPNTGDTDCAGTLLLNNKFVDIGCEDRSANIGLTYVYEYPIQECEDVTMEEEGVSYHFPATPPGSTANSLEVCPVYMSNANSSMANITCYDDVDKGPLWGNFASFDCGEELIDGDEGSVDDLQTLYDLPVTNDNVEDVAEDLAKITNNLTLSVSNVDDEEAIIYSALILEQIVSLNSTSNTVTTSVAASVDNLLEISNEVTEMSDESRSASSTIIKSLEEQLDTVASAGLNYTFSRKNLDIEVIQLQDDFALSGLVFYSSEKSPASVIPSEEYASENVTDLDTSLTLPSEVYDGGASHVKEEGIPGVFVLYKQSTLFPIANKSKNKNWTIGSRVISANIHGMETSAFGKPVIGVYTPTIHIPESERDIKCVFWDFKLENGIGDWSNEGCVYNATEDGRVICHCDHLTNFAVLMDYKGQVDHDATRYYLLSILSLVGCCVSLIALILTICTQIYTRYTKPFSREQHSTRPRLILLNFAIALSLLYLVFVVGIEQTKSKHVCIIIAVLLHYFTVSSISWMTVQAVNIYLSLVKVFPTYISKFRLKAHVFGWVIPLLPVVISLIFSTDSYSNEHYCFINPGPVLYFGNIAVVGALFLTNLVIFILVIRVLLCSRSRRVSRINDSKSKFTVAKEQVSTAIGLSILVGLTWIFGFAAIGETSSSNVKFSMQLLFCIFNSLQGLFVFLFFSVRTGDFKAFVSSCLSSLACVFVHSYQFSNKYDKRVTVSHDTADQSASMTLSTAV